MLSSQGPGISNYAALAVPGVIEWLSPLMAANDALIASTAGNTITLGVPWAVVTTATAVWASARTTALDDTISVAAANLPVVRIDADRGTDVLRVSDGGPLNLVNITSVEVLDLRETHVANSVTNMGPGFTTVYLGPHGDTVTITATAATVSGGPGNDRIAVGPGDLTINGGDGIDSVVLPLARAKYQLSIGASTPPSRPGGDHYFGRHEGGAVIEAKVAAQDLATGLAHLQSQQHPVAIPLLPAGRCRRVRCRTR